MKCSEGWSWSTATLCQPVIHFEKINPTQIEHLHLKNIHIKKMKKKKIQTFDKYSNKHIWALVYPTSPQNSEISVGFKNCKSTFFTSLMQCQNNNFKQHQVRGISQNLDHFCLSYFHICCFSAQWMIDPWNNKGQTVRYWYYKLHWQNTKGSNKAYNHFEPFVFCQCSLKYKLNCLSFIVPRINHLLDIEAANMKVQDI